MAVSPLATESYPAYYSEKNGNYTIGRAGSYIAKITLHHMAGVNSAEGCGRIFQTPGRMGSSHYGIGVNGEIANYVDEDNTAWTDSSWASNTSSVTIECSNSATGGDWPISDATMDSAIKLVADIAKRNGLGALVPGQNLTWHSMYAATTCPGDYMRARMQMIADRANQINDNPSPSPEPQPEPQPTPTGIKVGDKVVPKVWVDYYGTRLLQTRDCYYVSYINGNYAVLNADSVAGAVYAGMSLDNLTKVGDAPAPSTGVSVGDTVTLNDWVDYNGVPLYQTRPFYFVSEISGDRAVLHADSMSGAVYAAVNINNLRKA